MTLRPPPFLRRPQTPHEALSLMDANGAAYYLKMNTYIFDVISHGPEWVCIVRNNFENAPAMWRRWDVLDGLFEIEGNYDPLEKGEF